MTSQATLTAVRAIGLPRSLAGCAVLLAAFAVAGGTGSSTAAAAVAAAPPSCVGKTAAGPFTTGTNAQGRPVVLAGDGKPFISYGTSVPGLVGSPGRGQGYDNPKTWAGDYSKDQPKIIATREEWCGNTVRLQVSQDNLLGPGGKSFYAAYMAAIGKEVSLAESYDLNVVLNDSTESAPASVKNQQLGPDQATERFWHYMVDKYGKDPHVIFDLFNEPRTYSTGMSQATQWRLWWQGGTFDGTKYLGMEALAKYVRGLDSETLFWVEGPNYSASFAGMTTRDRQLGHDAVITVKNVVYAVHHPAGSHNPAGWNAAFGYLLSQHVAPVVEGEWTNFEPTPIDISCIPVGAHGASAAPNAPPPPCPPPPTDSACWNNAPWSVPAYLWYLAGNGVGMNAYQLAPDWLITNTSPEDPVPTIINIFWSCDPYFELQPKEGAGAWLRYWFRLQNGEQPPTPA